MMNEIHDLRERVEKLEARLDFLSRRLGIASGDMPEYTVSPTILALIKKGNKNEAMRALIEETGANLKDAKTIIESIQI